MLSVTVSHILPLKYSEIIGHSQEEDGAEIDPASILGGGEILFPKRIDYRPRRGLRDLGRREEEVPQVTYVLKTTTACLNSS